MTNKQKALKRERIRLRKSQNPQQVDCRKIDRLRAARTEFWKIKKRSGKAEEKTIAKVDTKKAKPEKKKKVKEPELEVIEDKPELEVIEEKLELEEVEPELEVIEEEPEKVEISKELEELYADDETEEEEVSETSE